MTTLAKRYDTRILYFITTRQTNLSKFRTSNDLMLSILIYLDIGVESVCHVDVAVTNTAERVIWLTIPRNAHVH